MNVLNVMTSPVISVPVKATIRDTISLMLKHQISGLPVVDDHGNLVGIISESDFLRRTEIGTEKKRNRWLGLLLSTGRTADEYIHAHSCKVEDVMTREPITVKEIAPLDEVARLMERHHVKRLPVVRGKKLVGIVTRANLIRAVITHGKSMRAPVEGDLKIRDQIIAQIAEQPWAPSPLFSVHVKDGVVTVSGTVFDGRQEEALKVLIENTPGVKSIENDIIWIEPTSGTVILPPENGKAKPIVFR